MDWRLVDDDDAGRTQRRAGLGHRFIVERRVELVGGQQLHGETAGHDGLDRRVLVLRAAAVRRRSARAAAWRGAVRRGRDTSRCRSGRRCACPALLRCRSVRYQSTPWRMTWVTLADGLHVVDDGRLGVETLDGREGRLHARVAAVAFQAGEQRRLLAALVGAGAAMDDDLQVLVRAEDLLAQEALGLAPP